jgi:hypothetical protein
VECSRCGSFECNAARSLGKVISSYFRKPSENAWREQASNVFQEAIGIDNLRRYRECMDAFKLGGERSAYIAYFLAYSRCMCF